jgi:universal stress protein A
MSALLVPYDFSAHSEAALATARELAARLGADLHLLHVMPEPTYATGGADGLAPTVREDLRAGAESMLSAVASSIDDGPSAVEARVRDGGDVVDEICRAASAIDAYLIVMGTHGRAGIAHAVLGSVAERTLRQAPCPVLTVRAREVAA